jgi:hypothetical protein
MKHIRQHVAERKVVWANKIAVTTMKGAGPQRVKIGPIKWAKLN